MKKLMPVIAAVVFCSCASAETPCLVTVSPRPDIPAKQTVSSDNDKEGHTSERINYPQQKAVWISYIDMASLCSGAEEEFRENAADAFDKIADLGLNTVYVHIRAFADAYYDSKLFCPAKVICSDGVSADYDPLDIMTELAHERDLSFHAWINPLRCDTADNMKRMKGTLPYEWYTRPDKYPEYISSPEGTPFYWLDPAVPEVRKLVADGVREICENYDVDGIHIDDYFYPTTDESFDKYTYAASGTDKPLDEWRLENCSLLVKEIHDAVKESGEDILFGVSPQGNIGNNYTQMYADVGRWCSEDGFIDYIVPQIYFGYENTVCPFSETLSHWRDMCTNDNVSLVCGLAVYKIGDEKEFSENAGIISDQIADCAAQNVDGIALYSFDSLFCKSEKRYETEREAIKMQLS